MLTIFRRMDAIRKKMQSLKAETEQLYSTIRRYEDATKEYSARADQVLIKFHLLYTAPSSGMWMIPRGTHCSARADQVLIKYVKYAIRHH
jgi:hypothetical protein